MVPFCHNSLVLLKSVIHTGLSITYTFRYYRYLPDLVGGGDNDDCLVHMTESETQH